MSGQVVEEDGVGGEYWKRLLERGWSFQGQGETWHKEISQEYTRMTSAKIPSDGGQYTELAISFNQTGA